MSNKIKMFPLVKTIFFLCLVNYAICENKPIVDTPLGEVQGYYMKTREERPILAFTSIPFAVPPLGNLRFKAPVPIEKWDSPLVATEPSPLCIQRNPYIRQEEIVGQEDCLYLNIYTPEIRTDKLLPVMVFIHGGGWMCGGSATELYGPEFLLDRDVVFVAINYRLGPLGFLSTQDEHCPGNNGLKDQQEALRFIQKVIHAFGGDKDSVTIFGESAGGASVHYHMLSETSSGLFDKGISESGTALVPWAEAPTGEAKRQAFRLAQLLGCPQSPSEAMLECLRAKDSYDLINTEFSFYAWDYEPMTPFKAVIEPDLPGAFLTRSPRETPAVPAVPWMTGLTKDEGCLKSAWISTNVSRYREFKSGFDAIAPVTFYYDNSPYVDLITKTIKDKYLNVDTEEEYTAGMLDIYTDAYFAYPLVEAVELTFNYTKKPIYLYQLSYRATNSFSQIFGNPEEEYVCHADELMYLFPIHFLTKPMSKQDIEMSKLFVTLFTNFATSGNPNKPVTVPLDWKPASNGEKMEYLDIGNEFKMQKHLAARSRFWGTLPLWHNIRKHRFIDEL